MTTAPFRVAQIGQRRTDQEAADQIQARRVEERRKEMKRRHRRESYRRHKAGEGKTVRPYKRTSESELGYDPAEEPF